MRHYDITALFYCIDEFCKTYQEWEKHRLIPKTSKRDKAGKLSLSEKLCIEILFHLSGFRDFKTFYMNMGLMRSTKDILSLCLFTQGLCISKVNYFYR